MEHEKTPWGTVLGTGAASIDIVLMDYPVDREFTVEDIEQEVKNRGLLQRDAVREHLRTLIERGYIERSSNGWRRVSKEA